MSPFVITILIAIIVLLVIGGPFLKGKKGELMVSMTLARLPKEHYRVFNDIILPTRYGTTQIDHIVVSPFGIFVIETKNYNGWIYGGENSENWTQNIWGNKYTFRNPLKQNNGHVKALKSILGVSETAIIPIVVFSNRADLSVQTNQLVINRENLRSVIKRYHTEFFPLEQIDNLCIKIELARETGKEAKKQHVRNVKQTVYRKNQAIAKGICPQCGGQLILRDGRYGSFYGCNNYPKCRFTLKA
jgi:hypothetical protein